MSYKGEDGKVKWGELFWDAAKEMGRATLNAAAVVIALHVFSSGDSETKELPPAQ